MTNIYNLISNTLSSLGYSVREQGSYKSGETLPETFITFLIIDSPGVGYADNRSTGRSTRVQISLYSKKPNIVQNADSNIKNLMLNVGFMRMGGGALPFDKETGHYSWRTDFKYYELED